jgi:hypothetical protein
MVRVTSLKGALAAVKNGASAAAKLARAKGTAFKASLKSLRTTMGGLANSLLGNKALRGSFVTAVKKGSANMMNQIANTVKKAGASIRKKFSAIFGKNSKFMAAMGKAKGVAAKVGSKVGHYASKCARSKRCAGAVIALAAFGYLSHKVQERLKLLKEAEQQCIADCLPDTDPDDPQKLVFKKPTTDTPLVCDGTEDTGEDADGCAEFCMEECTSVESKCEFLLPVLPGVVCDAAGSVAGALKNPLDFVGNLFGKLGETMKKVLMFVAIGIGALLVLSLIWIAVKQAVRTKTQNMLGGGGGGGAEAAAQPAQSPPQMMTMTMSPLQPQMMMGKPQPQMMMSPPQPQMMMVPMM